MIRFFVAGRPRVEPKKRRGKHGNIYKRDPMGNARGWAELVAIQAKMATDKMIPRGTPFQTTFWFFLRRPKSSKYGPAEFPLNPSSGDDDNYAYLVTNAMKGICYEDDCHRIDHHVYKRFADQNQFHENTTGVMVEVQEL